MPDNYLSLLESPAAGPVSGLTRPARYVADQYLSGDNSDLFSVFSRGFDDDDELGRINNVLFDVVKTRPDDTETFQRLSGNDPQKAQRLTNYNTYFRQRLSDFQEALPDNPEQRRIELVRRAAVDESLIEDIANATKADRTKLRQKAAKVYESNLNKFRLGELNERYETPAHATNDFLLRQIDSVQARQAGDEARKQAGKSALNPLNYLGGLGEGVKAIAEQPTQPFSPGGVFSVQPRSDRQKVNRYAASFIEGALGARPNSDPRPEVGPEVTDPRTGERTEGDGVGAVIVDRSLGVAGTVASFLGFGALAGSGIRAAQAGRFGAAGQKVGLAAERVSKAAADIYAKNAHRGLAGRALAGAAAESLRMGPKLMAFSAGQRGLAGGEVLDPRAIALDGIMVAINAGAIGAADELAGLLKTIDPKSAQAAARYGSRKSHQKLASKIAGQLADVKPGDLRARALQRLASQFAGVGKNAAGQLAEAENVTRLARASAGLFAGYAFDRLYLGVPEIDALTNGLFFGLVDLVETPHRGKNVGEIYRAKIAEATNRARQTGERIDRDTLLGEAIAEAADAAPGSGLERQYSELWKRARSEAENILAEDLSRLRAENSRFALSEAERRLKEQAGKEPVQGPEKAPKPLELPTPKQTLAGLRDKTTAEADRIKTLERRIVQLEDSISGSEVKEKTAGKEAKKKLKAARKDNKARIEKAREQIKASEAQLESIRKALEIRPEGDDLRQRKLAEIDRLEEELGIAKEQYFTEEGAGDAGDTGNAGRTIVDDFVRVKQAEADAKQYTEPKRQAEAEAQREIIEAIENAGRTENASGGRKRASQPERESRLNRLYDRVPESEIEAEAEAVRQSDLQRSEADARQAELDRIAAEAEQIQREIDESFEKRSLERSNEEKSKRDIDYRKAEKQLAQQQKEQRKTERIEKQNGAKSRAQAERQAEQRRRTEIESEARRIAEGENIVEAGTGKQSGKTIRAEKPEPDTRVAEAGLTLERGQRNRQKRLKAEAEQKRQRAEQLSAARRAANAGGPEAIITNLGRLEAEAKPLRKKAEVNDAYREFRDAREAKTDIPRLETDRSPKATPERIDTEQAPENAPDLFQAENTRDFVEQFATDWLERLPEKARPEFVKKHGIKAAVKTLQRHATRSESEAELSEPAKQFVRAYADELKNRRQSLNKLAPKRLAESKAVSDYLKKLGVIENRKPAKSLPDAEYAQAVVSDQTLFGFEDLRSGLNKVGVKLSSEQARTEYARLSRSAKRFDAEPNVASHLTADSVDLLNSAIDATKTPKADYEARAKQLAVLGRGVFRLAGFEGVAKALRDLNSTDGLTRPEILKLARGAYIDALRADASGKGVEKAMGEFFSHFATGRKADRFKVRIKADNIIETVGELNKIKKPKC